MALFKGSKESSTATVEGEAAAECMKVGQSLVDGGHLTAENMATALSTANGDLLQFVDLLLGRFGAGRTELALAVSQATNVPAVDTKGITIPDELKGVLDEKVVRQNCAVAVASEGNTLVVLCADPSPGRRKAIEAAAGKPVKFFLSDPATVRTFIDQVYRADADIDRLVQTFDVGDDQAKMAALAAEVSVDDQAPVVQLVTRIVSQAMRDRTSDIHVEPLDDILRVRFRIDGHLVEAFKLPIGVHAALTSRLKVMSGMN
ncbi:MAG TPA: hypothetical protein DCR14_16520, partial [Acidimicrobiaceae bacterium]|nr:hypothetical protein [Acidimicrobiaceae bacterium]